MLNICDSKYFYTHSKYSLCRKKLLPICFFGGEKCPFYFVKYKHMNRFPWWKFQLDQNLYESPTQPLRWLHVNLLYLDTDSVPTSDSQLPLGIWLGILLCYIQCFMINLWLNNIWSIIPQLLYFKFLCCSIIWRYPDIYILPDGCYQFLLLDI